MKKRHLRYQIFAYISITLVLWFVILSAISEVLYYLEEKRGIDLPLRFYVCLNIVQAILLLVMNVPFLRFLIKRVDKPVQKIIASLNNISKGNYDEKIDFEAKNELDGIKDAFNSMSKTLEEAERIKRNAENERIMLFANMAHDLKTPITSILGFSKALSDGIISDEAKKREYISTINSKARKMNELIDRLFEYVKLESSDNLLHKENADVAEILRNCVADVYAECEEKQIDLEIDIVESEVIKNVDKIELSRVFSNILTNLLKHNSEKVRALVKMDSSGRTIIADSGQKISDEEARAIFMPFVSLDSSRSSKNGSGLGLSLSKKIMEKHGGRLYLEQNIDGYSKAFVIEF